MGITITWDNEDPTLIHYRFDAHWTWQDLFEGWTHTLKMVKGLAHEVNIIADMSDSAVWLPYESHAVKELGDFPTPEQLGMVVLVGANVLIQSLWDVYSRLYPVRANRMNLRFARSEADARQIIADRRSGASIS